MESLNPNTGSVNLKLIKRNNMTSNFNLIGLSKRKSVTCAVIGGTEEMFWPKVDMSQDRFDAFWDYYATRKSDEKFTAVIEHQGLNDDGTPRNSILIEIKTK